MGPEGKLKRLSTQLEAADRNGLQMNMQEAHDECEELWSVTPWLTEGQVA